MGIKSKIKHSISFLLHGEAKPIYANIHYLAPNEHLKDKKIVITGGGRGLGLHGKEIRFGRCTGIDCWS